MSDSIVNDPRGGGVEILFTGDLVLDVEDAPHWLSGIAPATRAAALTIGHLEVPHSLRGRELEGDVPAPGADPENLAALKDAGFDAVSLAGNHMADLGAEGIADTIAGLDALGIAHTGAGPDVASARRPAMLAGGVALLSYNCVGPEDGEARDDRAGFVGLPIATVDGSKVTPIAPLERITPETEAMLRADIAAAREAGAAVVVVALHKGIVHTPAKLAPYERPVAHAAIEAGADVVVGHHAHIVRGIEFRCGKPIFHGLGNGCVVTRALSPDQDHPKRKEWAERRKTLFGFEPDPAYSLAPFHPEAVHAMLGRVVIQADGRVETGLIAVHVEAPGRPVLADADRAAKIAGYIADITVKAGLPALAVTPAGTLAGGAARYFEVRPHE